MPAMSPWTTHIEPQPRLQSGGANPVGANPVWPTGCQVGKYVSGGGGSCVKTSVSVGLTAGDGDLVETASATGARVTGDRVGSVLGAIVANVGEAVFWTVGAKVSGAGSMKPEHADSVPTQELESISSHIGGGHWHPGMHIVEQKAPLALPHSLRHDEAQSV